MCICLRQLHFRREMENFLSLHWCSPQLHLVWISVLINVKMEFWFSLLVTLKMVMFLLKRSFLSMPSLRGKAPTMKAASASWKKYITGRCRVPRLRYNKKIGREPWSSGYGRRLTFQRSWVRILAPDTGCTWHIFTLICCKNCIVCLKRPEINEKEAGVGPVFKILQINRQDVPFTKMSIY